MNFKLEDAPAIINTLKYYYQEKNMEKKTGRTFEEQLYKATELFRYADKGQVYASSLESLEEYFGVPAFSYLIDRQEYYMAECIMQKTLSQLKSYLKHPFLKNGRVKFSIYKFREMVGNMK